MSLGEGGQDEAVSGLEPAGELAMGHDACHLHLHACRTRLLLEVQAPAAITDEDQPWPSVAHEGERFDETDEILLLLEPAHVDYGWPRGHGARSGCELLRVDAVGKVGEPRPRGMRGKLSLYLVRGDDDAGRPGKGRAFEPAVETWLEAGPRDARDLGVVIAVGNHEGRAEAPARHQRGDHAGKLLDAEGLALAELARVEHGEQQGVEADRPASPAGKEHDLVEELSVGREVGEGLAEVAEVVNAVVGVAVAAQVVIEESLVLARAPKVTQPAAEGGQDADGAQRSRRAHVPCPYARSRSSTMRSSLNFLVTVSEARRPSDTRRSASARRRSTAPASAPASLRSTSRPVASSSTASGVPPMRVPTTGRASAAASRGTRLNGSGHTAGCTTTSASL